MINHTWIELLLLCLNTHQQTSIELRVVASSTSTTIAKPQVSLVFDVKVFRLNHSQRNVNLLKKVNQVEAALSLQRRRHRECGMNIMVIIFNSIIILIRDHLNQDYDNILCWTGIHDFENMQFIDDSITHLQVGVILLDYIVFTLPGLIVLEVDLKAERNENVGFIFK